MEIGKHSAATFFQDGDDMKKFTTAWLWLAVAMPVVFGLGFLFQGQMMADQNGPVALAHLVGIRQIVFGVLLAIAVLKFPPQTSALLLVGRGVTDLGDAFALMMSTQSVPPPVVFPLVAGIVSLVVARELWASSPTSK